MRPLWVLLALSLLACNPSGVRVARENSPDASVFNEVGPGGTRSPSGDAGSTALPDGGSDAGVTPIDAGVPCGVFELTLRDFKDEHPDFEEPSYSSSKGIVRSELGSDRKPVYAHDGGIPGVVHSPESFAQWYQDVPGINLRFQRQIVLTPEDGGYFSYSSSEFFPLDDAGFGNQGRFRNFHFTTEFHGSFMYRGGEVFTFTGDDDLFVFVNGKLALDLGGVHAQMSDSINFDARAAEWGLTTGETYPLDIFHAERHTNQSNFRITTTIDCIQTVNIN